jgi:hypothetical protein
MRKGGLRYRLNPGSNPVSEVFLVPFVRGQGEHLCDDVLLGGTQQKAVDTEKGRQSYESDPPVAINEGEPLARGRAVRFE